MNYHAQLNPKSSELRASYLPSCLYLSEGGEPQIDSFKLNSKHFITRMSFQQRPSAPELLELLNIRFQTGFIMRGVPETFLAQQKTGAFKQTLLSGYESWLELKNYRAHSSLRELAKRASRKLELRRLTASEFKYYQSKLLSKHFPARVELRGLYLSSDEGCDFFFGAFQANTALGLLSASSQGHGQAQLQVLLRAKSAPAGTMESLVLKLVEELQRENFSELCLGESPFAELPPACNHYEQALRALAFLIKPEFNWSGLARFKEKFRGKKQRCYFVSSKRLSSFELYRLAQETAVWPLLKQANKTRIKSLLKRSS